MAKAEYRSAIRSRKLINTALADLLQEKPLDKITVTDIVNRAEINRGTFYAHYANIPDVVNHLVQQTFSSIRQALMEQPQPLTDVSHTLLVQVQKILEEDLFFYKKIMHSGAAPILQEQLVNTVLDYMFQNEDAFGFGSHEEYAVTMRFCAGGLSNLYRDWFAGKLTCSLDELTRKAEMLLQGVLTGARSRPQRSK